jgi:hypothetical protein
MPGLRLGTSPAVGGCVWYRSDLQSRSYRKGTRLFERRAPSAERRAATRRDVLVAARVAPTDRRLPTWPVRSIPWQTVIGVFELTLPDRGHRCAHD